MPRSPVQSARKLAKWGKKGDRVSNVLGLPVFELERVVAIKDRLQGVDLMSRPAKPKRSRRGDGAVHAISGLLSRLPCDDHEFNADTTLIGTHEDRIHRTLKLFCAGAVVLFPSCSEAALTALSCVPKSMAASISPRARS